MLLGFSQIRAQESRRRQHYGNTVFFNQLSILCGFERVRVSDNRRALDQRIPEGDGAAEAVEKRQGGQEELVFPGVEKDGELGDIAEDVAVTEDNAFRFSRTPTGKKQNCFFMSALSRQIEPAR